MVAICALVGIKVNFVDFVALPITLDLGIGYAIVTARSSVPAAASARWFDICFG
ncbi:MAG: hypothetical protein JWP01_944 [Myxococcales bacterium]|nr:hypothetical protein [Myxococcales bacterium]MDB5526893.1 hypothetical protein [Rhizobium sp.]